jgi:hypothetical protein
MSFGFFSNRRPHVQQQPVQQDGPHYAVPNSGSGQGFLVVSALVHIVAVVALMHSWSGGIPRARAETTTASSAPRQPTTPRLSIDLAPVKFCEMDMAKIVGRPRESSR